MDVCEPVFLSVVLPCRNQADHIREVVERYFAPLDRYGKSYELIVVPNASTDGTTAVVQEMAQQDSRVRAIENPEGGWGRSVLVGLSAARGEHLCYTNSARTEPETVVELLELYEKRLPCLAKVRREQRGILSREVGSWLYNLEGRLLYGITSGDVNGTPKIFSRDLWERLDLQSLGDLLDMELLAKVRRMNIPVVDIPVRGFKRHGGKSTTKLGSAWRMYTQAFGLRPLVERIPKR